MPTVPTELQLVISAVVTFLVVGGLKELFELTGHDLSDWGTVIAAGISAVVVFAVNTGIGVAVQIDPSLEPKIEALFQIVVILIGAMGAKRVWVGEYATLKDATVKDEFTPLP